MLKWLVPPPRAICTAQFVTLVQVTGYSAPFTLSVVTSIDAVPVSVTEFVFTLKSAPPLLVTEKFTVTAASCWTR